MTKEQISRLFSYIDARIDLKIAQNNGDHDTYGEFERDTDARDDLLVALGLKEAV